MELETDVAVLKMLHQEREKDMEELRAQLTTLFAKVEEIQKTLNTAQGSWRTVLFLGTLLAGVAEFIAELLKHTSFK